MLIAHPLLDDDRFAHTILFIESDTGKKVTGLILNRPLNIMLKALGANFENLPVSNVPVYHGGIDGESTVMLTAWVFDSEKRTFEIYYTLDGDEAAQLLRTRKNIQLRAFLGYCSFDKKLYDDIEKGLWIVGDAKKLFGAEEHAEALWRKMLLEENPNALVYK
ncbi:MAG: YqgE/AlgH family protein [Puniceicoccales bacterium]|nr:YqgE/AlgH family protein [Puniceicoccales bacterium]